MESLRLKWQEVKGECTENSRQLYTTAAAVDLPSHSTVMVWENGCLKVQVCVCASVCMCVRLSEKWKMSQRFIVYTQY